MKSALQWTQVVCPLSQPVTLAPAEISNLVLKVQADMCAWVLDEYGRQPFSKAHMLIYTFAQQAREAAGEKPPSYTRL